MKAVMLIIAGLLLVTAQPAMARSFSPIGESNGLEARSVSALTVDSRGFLWVASREGLYRYDGYQALAILPEPGDPESISDVDVRCVFEASDGSIWAGTNTGGLNRLDVVSGRVQRFRHDSSRSDSLADDSVHGIGEGPGGGLWIATANGLSRLDRQFLSFETHRHDPDDPGSLPHDVVSAVHRGADGQLWVATMGGGLGRWNSDRGDFTRWDLAALAGGDSGSNDVYALLQDARGIVWAGTRRGLVRLDPDRGTARFIDLGEQTGYLPVVRSLVAVGGDRLWLGTMIRGVLIVDTVSGEWAPAASHATGAPGSLPRRPQLSLAASSGSVFVGTRGEGVYRTPLEPGAFTVLAADAEAGSANVTSVMATSEAGRPWLGTFGDGPLRVGLEEGWPGTAETGPDSLHQSGVLAMARLGASRYFAATTNGLYEFDEYGGERALYRHQPGRPDGIGSGYAVSLLPAGEGALWVGMGGSGLQRFDAAAGRFAAYRHDAADGASLSGNFVTALLDEPEGRLWVGTRSDGLNLCSVTDWSCQRFSGRDARPGDLSHYHVTALYRDRRGRVWVATDGGGVHEVLRDASGQVSGFRRWGKSDGLLSDGVMAIGEDLDESLWLSSRRGLSRINPATGRVVNYVTESGLPVRDFNRNASAADSAYVYFGSEDGLLSIPKGSLLEERAAAPVRITAMYLIEPGDRRRPIGPEGGELQLDYGDILSIELAVLDYSETFHDYAYRMRDQESWTGLGRQRQILFHGLAPGDYSFQARGRDVFGSWGESRALSLRVNPPFWMTNTFLGLMILLLAALLLAIVKLREATLRRRAREIQRLSDRRERALEQQLGSEAELAVLTPRQKEVLQLIAEGLSTRDIAERLGVSVKTVEAHRSNLMERLEIHDVPGLVRVAIRSRLVSLQEQQS